MSAVKEEAFRIVESLNENESWEDLMYKIYVRESIEHGLSDISKGMIYANEDVEKRLSKWLK